MSSCWTIDTSSPHDATATTASVEYQGEVYPFPACLPYPDDALKGNSSHATVHMVVCKGHVTVRCGDYDSGDYEDMVCRAGEECIWFGLVPPVPQTSADVLAVSCTQVLQMPYPHCHDNTNYGEDNDDDQEQLAAHEQRYAFAVVSACALALVMYFCWWRRRASALPYRRLPRHIDDGL